MTVHTPQELNVKSIIDTDYIIATKKGLINLEHILESRHSNYFRNRRVPREANVADKIVPHLRARYEKKQMKMLENNVIEQILGSEEQTLINDKPLAVMSRSLRGYVREMIQEQKKRASEGINN